MQDKYPRSKKFKFYYKNASKVFKYSIGGDDMAFVRDIPSKDIKMSYLIKFSRLYIKYINMPNARLVDPRFQKTLEQIHLNKPLLLKISRIAYLKGILTVKNISQKN